MSTKYNNLKSNIYMSAYSLNKYNTAINLLNDKINTNVEKYEHEIKELCDIFRTKMDESSNNNLKMTNGLIDEMMTSNNEDIFKYIDDFCDEKIDNIYDKITNIEMTIDDQYNELKNENKLLKNKINELEKKIEKIFEEIILPEEIEKDDKNEIKKMIPKGPPSRKKSIIKKKFSKP